MTRNTDVPNSIAGYYYQIMLAVNELVNSLEDENKYAVAIEKGSDIKVMSLDHNDYCIEAKFYKTKSFTKFHNTIRHTMYNFFNDFKSGTDNKYMFKTNVPVCIDDKEFFDRWSEHTQEYITFVKDCIVHEAIKLNEDSKRKFADFIETTGLTSVKEKFEHCYKQLIEQLHENPNNYSIYYEMGTDDEIVSFLGKISFSFGNQTQTKLHTINSLKSQIETKISGLANSLTCDDCRKIINLLVEKFFETTINPNFDQVTKNEFNDTVRDYQESQLKFLNNEQVRQSVIALEEEIARFKFFLDQYAGDKNDDLIETYISLVETFFEEVENSKLQIDEVIKKYSLDSYQSAKLIARLLYSMTTLAVFSSKNISNVKLFGLKGINNFSFNEAESYCLKSTDSAFLDETSLLLNALVPILVDEADKIAGGEKIVFESPYLKPGFEPCVFNKNDLDELVINTAQVDENLKYQALLKSLEYRCLKCVRFNLKDDLTISQLRRFNEEACCGTDN